MRSARLLLPVLLLARPLPAADATALLTRRLADVTAGRAGDTVR